MKYTVMQCCKGYAVLMDEDSRFVFAANKNYEVGQLVTNPFIMSNDRNCERNIPAVIKVISTAAACVALISGLGYGYYARNLKTYSVVTISSDSNISMELNKSGKVIRLESDTDNGKAIIEKTSVKGLDKITATNEILQAEISHGYISDGDVIDVYVSGSSDAENSSLLNSIENELPEMDVKVNIHHGKVDKHNRDEIGNDSIKPDKGNKNDRDDATPVKPAVTTATKAVDASDKNKPVATKPVPVQTAPVAGDKFERPGREDGAGRIDRDERPDKVTPEIDKRPEPEKKPEQITPPVVDGEKPVAPETPETPEAPKPVTPEERPGREEGKWSSDIESGKLPHHYKEYDSNLAGAGWTNQKEILQDKPAEDTEQIQPDNSDVNCNWDYNCNQDYSWGYGYGYGDCNWGSNYNGECNWSCDNNWCNFGNVPVENNVTE